MEIERDFKTPSQYIDKAVTVSAEKFKQFSVADKHKFIAELKSYGEQLRGDVFSEGGVELLCIYIDNIEKGYDVHASRVVSFCLTTTASKKRIRELLMRASFGDAAFKVTLKKMVETIIWMMVTAAFKGLSIPTLLLGVLKEFIRLTTKRISALLSVFNFFSTKAQKEQNGGHRSAPSFGFVSAIVYVARFLKRNLSTYINDLKRR